MVIVTMYIYIHIYIYICIYIHISSDVVLNQLMARAVGITLPLLVNDWAYVSYVSFPLWLRFPLVDSWEDLNEVNLCGNHSAMLWDVTPR